MELLEFDKKKIEDYWRIDRQKRRLHEMEQEILHPYQETDTNIGGGRSCMIGNTTQNKALLLLDNTAYNHLKSVIETVERMYHELDDDFKVMIDMRYCSKLTVNEWEDIAAELGYSLRKIMYMRNNLIEETAKRINYC